MSAALELSGVKKRFGETEIVRGVDLAVTAIVADLKKHSKNVTSNEEIAQDTA